MIKNKKKPVRPAQKRPAALSPFQKKMQSIKSPEELMKLARDMARGQRYEEPEIDSDEEFEDEDGAYEDDLDVEEEEEIVLPEKKPAVVHRRAVSTALVPRASEPAPVEKKEKEPSYMRMPWYVYGMSETEAYIMDLYSKGMGLGKICDLLQKHHNMKIDERGINAITDKVLPLVKEWQARPLSSQYMVLYLDGFARHVAGKNKVAYVALGINAAGKKEILGLWLNETEGAKFWGGVLADIRSRGVQDVLITCVDGLKGFPESIKSVFPYSDVQICVVHMIRKTLMHISNKDRKQFAVDLKLVYTARDAETAFQELTDMEEKWPQYAGYLKNWKNNWQNIITFFNYPYSIRRIIYTTNTIENLNRQFRAAVNAHSKFDTDDQLLKVLWLAQANIAVGWHVTTHDWGAVMCQFQQTFGDRVDLS
jgi:putative transposase